MRSGNRKKYLAIMIAAVMVFQLSFFGSLKASAAETEPAPDQVTVMQDGTVVEGENKTEDVVTEPGYTNAPEQQVSEEAAAEEQAEPAEAAESFEEPAAAEDQNQKQPAAKGSSKKELKVKKTKADEKEITIKVGTLTKTYKDPELYLPQLPNNEVPYTLEGDLSDEERSLLTEIITFKHGNSTTDGSVNYPNAGTYSLEVEDPEVISASMPEGYTINYEAGKLVIAPKPITVTITGHNRTARYDGSTLVAAGYDVSSNYGKRYVDLKKKYRNQNKTVVKRKNPGKSMMGLKASMFESTNDNFDVTFKVVDGYVKVYPKDGPVPEPEEDNNGSGSSSRNGNSSNGNGSGNSYGYYDANGNWVNYNGGYYDANGNWVNTTNDGNGGNGTSASTGDNGNGNGNGSSAGQEGSQSGTETIDDSSTPTTDGSGTETIEDDDTPQATPDEGENADDEEDGMNNILPIILAIIAAIIAFLIILFTKRRRNDSQ